MSTATPRTGTADRPLSVGATFITVALTFVAGQLVGGGVLVAAAVLVTLLTRGTASDLVRAGTDTLMAHPLFVCLAAATAGTTLVLATLLALKAVRVPFRAGTGLVVPKLWHIPVAVLMVMATGPFADLAVRAVRYFLPGFTLGVLESLGEAARTDGPELALVFASVSLVPGIAEELFFRGLVQRSLIGRLGGPIGVVIASLLFGAFHVDPPQAVGAAVLGLSLGYVTWKTKSVIPAMIAHASNNALALWASRAAGGESNEIELTTHVTVLGFSGVALAACALALLRGTPRPPERVTA
ncbi:MAG: CPBP family intramembrane metalloprotease [Polyangiaceae bacterium]|nr:CPBP family intramembrane metalloprotease [Polyangiaceae bacterium]